MASRAPIIETVTTTTNPDGSVNCAAMGVEWAEPELRLRPYRGTRTLRNLRERPSAVVHLTDDVLLFAAAALGDPRPATRPAGSVDGAIIVDAGSWRAVEITAIDDSGDPAVVSATVVAGGEDRPQLGLNRARHAVVEASILASRLDRTAAADVDAELARLDVLVDKTAGPREVEAMALVHRFVATRRARA